MFQYETLLFGKPTVLPCYLPDIKLIIKFGTALGVQLTNNIIKNDQELFKNSSTEHPKV